jgi:SAM-dependent methyltransferase
VAAKALTAAIRERQLFPPKAVAPCVTVERMTQSPPDPPAKPRDYKDYVTDTNLATVYAAYQDKYAENPRESDKRSAQLVLQSLRTMQPLGHRPRILDIGCSTGNFLRHLKRLNINADLIGGDLMEPHLDLCRKNPALAGVSFEVMDVFKIPTDQPFDIITANAVNVYFAPDLYGQALLSIAHALRPGGYFIAYEWVHQAPADTRITETSEWQPNGLTFWFRSRAATSLKLEEAGFDRIDIQPFEIPVDLPEPIPGSFEDRNLVTYTIKTSRGRLMMRGGLNQPWAHIVARKG